MIPIDELIISEEKFAEAYKQDVKNEKSDAMKSFCLERAEEHKEIARYLTQLKNLKLMLREMCAYE